MKKVQKAKPRGDGLRLRIPTDIKLVELANDGLLAPDTLSDSEAYAPLDFTSISPREVGQQHSAWAVRHSYLIFLIGNIQAEVANLKHDLKMAEASWMIDHKGEYKNKWEAEHAMGRNKKIKKYRRDLSKASIVLIRYEALAVSYEGLRNAASREIARRSDERASRD